MGSKGTLPAAVFGDAGPDLQPEMEETGIMGAWPFRTLYYYAVTLPDLYDFPSSDFGTFWFFFFQLL